MHSITTCKTKTYVGKADNQQHMEGIQQSAYWGSWFGRTRKWMGGNAFMFPGGWMAFLFVIHPGRACQSSESPCNRRRRSAAILEPIVESRPNPTLGMQAPLAREREEGRRGWMEEEGTPVNPILTNHIREQLLLPAIPHEMLIVTSLENARSSSEKSTRLGTLQHIPDDEHGPLRGSVGSLPAAVVSDATVQFEATNSSPMSLAADHSLLRDFSQSVMQRQSLCCGRCTQASCLFEVLGIPQNSREST